MAALGWPAQTCLRWNKAGCGHLQLQSDASQLLVRSCTRSAWNAALCSMRVGQAMSLIAQQQHFIHIYLMRGPCALTA